MTKPIASLSLDLDNKWSYLRTHGIESWRDYPSYLDLAVPRILRFCEDHELQMTCFVVGRDAELPQSRDALASIADAGHEIGNHSLNHYPWMHKLPRKQVEAEVAGAELLIEEATGQQPVGFRGPGYSFSEDLLAILASRGYSYDASILPTYIGPLARWYFRRTATPEAAQRAEEREIFGSFREGWRSLRPKPRATAAGHIIEIPVTTCPLVKMPIHMTYLLQLWQLSARLTKLYLRMALSACRWSGVGPSILLHPLDFLGSEDDRELRFFPGMNVPRSAKLNLLNGMLAHLSARFNIVPMRQHAEHVRSKFGLAAHKPVRKRLLASAATPNRIPSPVTFR
ncbi:MAG TPA: polysaccharide deacetylase family protein [Lacipirellulaceae bacterium]|nr:polysaccharide deacetylase family protein [Lacipirellulaceae bacterium]